MKIFLQIKLVILDILMFVLKQGHIITVISWLEMKKIYIYIISLVLWKFLSIFFSLPVRPCDWWNLAKCSLNIFQSCQIKVFVVCLFFSCQWMLLFRVCVCVCVCSCLLRQPQINRFCTLKTAVNNRQSYINFMKRFKKPLKASSASFHLFYLSQLSSVIHSFVWFVIVPTWFLYHGPTTKWTYIVSLMNSCTCMCQKYHNDILNMLPSFDLITTAATLPEKNPKQFLEESTKCMRRRK